MLRQGLTYLGAFLLLCSCRDTIPGNLNVDQDLTFNGKRNRTHELIAGDYQAEIKFRSKTKLRLTVSQEGEKERKFNFSIPEGTRLPEKNGSISLTAEQVGQPYDIQGDLRTDVSHGGSLSETETCQYRRPTTVCSTDPRGRTRCRTEYVLHYGWRNVQYRLRTEVKNINLNLITEGETHASFSGARTDAFKEYSYIGNCF